MPATSRQEEPDRGDTLVEVLVAVVILGLAAVALIGSLLTTTASATTNRSVSTVDAVLKNFADTARSTIETQASNGGSGPKFVACATPSSYQVVGSPMPRSGPAGSIVTVFGTGFSASSGVVLTQVSVANPTSTTLSATFRGSSSGASVQFSIPSTLTSGTYSVSPFDASHAAAAYFTVTSSGTPAVSTPLSYFTLSTTVNYWTGSGWSSTFGCTAGSNANTQQLTYTVTDMEPNNGSSDTANVVVANFKAEVTPSLTLSCLATPPGGSAAACTSSSYSLGTSFSFTATLTGDSTPTGTLTWSGLPSTLTSCTTQTSISSGTATATCNVALKGSYQPSVTYSGDASYSGVAASTVGLTVAVATTTIRVTSSPSSPTTAPANLTFTAQIVGVIPAIPPASSGTIQWGITTTASAGVPAGSTCSSQVAAPSSSPYSVSCTVPGASSGSYTVTATYSGDSNYAGGSGSATVLVQYSGTPVLTVTPSAPTVGSTVTFSATVTQPSGAPTPTGSITWSGTGLPASCTSAPTALPASPGPYTVQCSIPNASAGTYSAVATYGGDGNYTGGASSPASATVKYPATVTVTCSSPSNCSSSTQAPGANLTFTATVAQPSGAPPPSGQVQLTLTTGATGVTTTCNSSQTLSTTSPYSVTCTVTSAPVGNYSVNASYLGDGNYYSQTNSSPTVSVGPALSLSCTSPNNCYTTATKQQSLTFTASFPSTGTAPTGNLVWSLTLTPNNNNKPPQTLACGAGSTNTWSGGTSSYQEKCVVPATQTAGSLTVVATYPGGDPVYPGQSTQTTVAVGN